MLGRKYEYKLKYNEELTIDLNFNFKTLQNMFDLFGKIPLDVLSDFVQEENTNSQVVIMAQLIYCMTDGSIPIGVLVRDIFEDEEDIENIRESLLKIYFLEFKDEYPKKKKDKLDLQMEEEYREEADVEEDDEVAEEEKSEVVKFNEFWNYFYYLAIYQLRISQDEFLNSTVRELATLERYHRDFLKDTMLSAYAEVQHSKHKASYKSTLQKSPKEVKLSATANNGVRIKDLLQK